MPDFGLTDVTAVWGWREPQILHAEFADYVRLMRVN